MDCVALHARNSSVTSSRADWPAPTRRSAYRAIRVATHQRVAARPCGLGVARRHLPSLFDTDLMSAAGDRLNACLGYRGVNQRVRIVGGSWTNGLRNLDCHCFDESWKLRASSSVRRNRHRWKNLGPAKCVRRRGASGPRKSIDRIGLRKWTTRHQKRLRQMEWRFRWYPVQRPLGSVAPISRRREGK
jgi:hypothetical protein